VDKLLTELSLLNKFQIITYFCYKKKKKWVVLLIFFNLSLHAQFDSTQISTFIGKPIKALVDSLDKHNTKIIGRTVLTRSGIVFCGYWLKLSNGMELKLYINELNYVTPSYYLKNEKKNYRLFFKELLSEFKLIW